MILPFELDPQIIQHIIYSQAGSIGKAIIELLMNSVDAKATTVKLTMTKEGFTCFDDGAGFASKEDVLRYFGRFGTPHEEGDATYGRFRLGRGQIMAHASTVWQSHDWQMTVDTREMGYNYDLIDLTDSVHGCSIVGTWYDPLTATELSSSVQEIRDLVRYTPVSVELNGQLITRNPRDEKWDHEDEFAYYRAKAEGAVSIYNQGVLVRHDSAHIWGAGGLIVSKQALGLNISRTEILRKTCPVWKPIAKQFGKMAEAISAKLGDHRKTEARREKSARALLSGDPKALEIFQGEEVITVLPGKRHITLNNFLRKAKSEHHEQITVVEDGFDIPKAESIARLGMIQLVHPQTLERFGCYCPEDFRECLEQIAGLLKGLSTDRSWDWQWMFTPEMVSFPVLRDAFVERTQLVSEKTELDKETRRAWIALRWCIQQYAGACAGGKMQGNGRLHWHDHDHCMSILLGESNTADAWTDGKSYIAFDIKIVKRLKTEPLKTAAYIFSLAEHEVAHQGDSLDCGHDEAFYQRYHDISIRMSPERQRYIHMWMMKYTTSLESEGKKASGRAWAERYLVDRTGNGREKRGLSPIIEDVTSDPVVTSSVPEENMAFIQFVNSGLTSTGTCPPPPDWGVVLKDARLAWQESVEQQRSLAAKQAAEMAEKQAFELQWEAQWIEEQLAEEMAVKSNLVTILGIDESEINDSACHFFFCHQGISEEDIREAWATKAWENEKRWLGIEDEHQASSPEHLREEMEEDKVNNPLGDLNLTCRELALEGETEWTLERNAAAAGFFCVEDYLKWRANETQNQ